MTSTRLAQRVRTLDVRIERVSDAVSGKSRLALKADGSELMGASEVAACLGVTVSNLKDVGSLPEPVARIRATRIWLGADIEVFAEARVAHAVRPVQPLEQFGLLQAVHPTDERRGGGVVWRCQCACGRQCDVVASHLRAGSTVSCGNPGCKPTTSTHGLSGHPLYGMWANMRQRCENPNHPNYPAYGGRGIKVCDRWRGEFGFPNLLADVGERPPDPPGWAGDRAYYSLDRIDNDGNYEPGNVRWATSKEQNNNRRSRSKAATA